MSDFNTEQYLDELYNKIIQYECKYSNDFYEICVLVSKAGVALLESLSLSAGYSELVRLQTHPSGSTHYLYGNRIIFVNEDYIPDFNHSYCHVIRPVIVCKDSYVFPVEADVGDFVIYNNTIRQISNVELIDGDRTVTVSDIYVRLNDFFDPIGYHESIHRMRGYSRGWIDVCIEDWVEDPDTSAITEYFNSLTIT